MKKRVIDGKVRAWHHKIFTVLPAGRSEKKIIIHFGVPVGHEVVKLRVDDLPLEDEKHNKITWFNNFAIRDASGQYLNGVQYTVFVPKLSRHKSFIYYADSGLKTDKTPKRLGSKPPRSKMIQLDLDRGDPGMGCRDEDKPIR